MEKYRVVSSVGSGKEFMEGIEFNYDISDDSIGREVNCLGGTFNITQNGKFLSLANPDWCLTLMRLEDKEPEDDDDLKINENFDIFLEDKEVEVRKKATYKELYDALKKEWEFIEKMTGDKIPFEYDEGYKLFTFLDGWKFKDGSLKNMSDGSFSRKSEDGRNI